MAAKSFSNPLLDAGFPKLKSRIIERTGHFYYQDKDDLLWERVRKRMRATSTGDSTQYLALLDDRISGPAEWTKLEAEITIGETFFFRYAEQFTALRDTILPEIIERKQEQGERRLRIWSAGCATGAEPYSLAILVSELLGPQLEQWRTTIVGTDINESFMEVARQARFGKWALRSMQPQERDRYFLPGKGEQWQLRPEFRSLVRFERHNLLSLLDGTSPLEFSEFDLILCRNVLIYFHPDTVTQVVQALRDCLADRGWMLLGHAEPNPAFANMMQALSLPGTVAYRQGAGEAPPPREKAPESWAPLIPLPEKPAAQPKRPVPVRTTQPPPAPAPQSLPEPSEPDSLLDQVRDLANLGDFRTAQTLCTRALGVHPLNPALHLYQGLIAQALNRPEEAEKCFLKGIYLDTSFAMAHYHLGLLLLAEGRPSPGRRSLTNAASIAAGLADDQEMAEGDGLTARDLRNLVRIHLEAATRSERKGRR
ncbi:CheR family methyltransferase [Microvirga sp. 2YAF29]|uniref:CheR family methyltransferase n=1 Tax=Microvirga sp. 2YAF29 TaxID=3233031 RepID=UPI003F9D359E